MIASYQMTPRKKKKRMQRGIVHNNIREFRIVYKYAPQFELMVNQSCKIHRSFNQRSDYILLDIFLFSDIFLIWYIDIALVWYKQRGDSLAECTHHTESTYKHTTHWTAGMHSRYSPISAYCIQSISIPKARKHSWHSIFGMFSILFHRHLGMN